jgi:hypothetical protein
MTRTDVATVQAAEKGGVRSQCEGPRRERASYFQGGNPRRRRVASEMGSSSAPARRRGRRDGSGCPAAQPTVIWRTQRVTGTMQLHEDLNLVALGSP